MSNDCFPIASMRHYFDGTILQNHGRFDNAMCHYAFSAECWIKLMLYHYLNVSFHRHDMMEDIMAHLHDYYEMLGFANPELYPILKLSIPPEVLFDNHPDRRYWGDLPYSESQVSECQRFVESLMDNLVLAVLDGKVTW